jgi:hypothetical protein
LRLFELTKPVRDHHKFFPPIKGIFLFLNGSGEFFRAWVLASIVLTLSRNISPASFSSSSLSSETVTYLPGIPFGPACAPMTPFLNEVSVIKGIEMRRDGGHGVNFDMMISGFANGSAAEYSAELAHVMKSGPLGVVRSGFNPVLLGTRSVTVSSVDDLKSGQFLRPGSRSLIPSNENWFQSQTNALDEIQVRFSRVTEIANQLQVEGTSDENIALLCACLQTESAYQASYAMEDLGNMDSHSGHEGSHLEAQTGGWNRVADLISTLKRLQFRNTGSNMLDMTTVMVVSEFSRTPALNPSQGKDHNPHANAVLLAGKGVKKGVVLGDSHVVPAEKSSIGIAMQRGYPFDYKLGSTVYTKDELTRDVAMIFPEDIAATVELIFGNPMDFHSSQDKGNAISSIVEPI